MDTMIDTLLLVGVLSVVAFQIMFQTRAEPVPLGATRANILAIESTAMQLDAAVGLPDAAGEMAGFVDAGATPREMLSHLEDTLSQGQATPDLKLVWIAIAVSYREDRAALSAIAALAREPTVLKANEATLDALTRLAGGRAVDAISPLVQHYEALGASEWLSAHLRERQSANAGDTASQATAAAEFTDIAKSYIGRRFTTVLVQLGLIVVGLLTLGLFPLWRRRMIRRGHAGLLGTASPFRHQRTRRVFLAWVLGAFFIDFTLSMFGAYAGLSPRGVAFTLALGSISKGLLAVGLIQSWGRSPDDRRPLGAVLGLTTEALPRRALGLAAWLVPGVGVGFAMTFIGIVLGALLGVQPDAQQFSIQLVLSDDHLLSWLGVALGAGLVAPLVEEILFRGFIFRNLRDQIGRGWAIVLSGIIFGAVHMEPSVIIPLSVFGIGLAMLYEWTGSLLVPIAAHAAWNLMTLVSLHVQTHV